MVRKYFVLLVLAVAGLVLFTNVRKIAAVAFTCEWCGNSCVKAGSGLECTQNYLPSDNFNKDCIVAPSGVGCTIVDTGDVSLSPTVTPTCVKQPGCVRDNPPCAPDLAPGTVLCAPSLSCGSDGDCAKSEHCVDGMCQVLTRCPKPPIGICQTETSVPHECPKIENLPDGTVCSRTEVSSNGMCSSGQCVEPFLGPPLNAHVSYSTGSVTFKADMLQIEVGGESFSPAGVENVRVISDPPDYGASNEPQTTTLELTWNQFGKEMRMNMYFNFDIATKMWNMNELSTYDGKNPGGWLYYKAPSGMQIKMSDNPLKTEKLIFKSIDDKGLVTINNIELSVNFLLYPNCGGTKPAWENGNANCDEHIDILDFAVWRSDYINGVPTTSDFNKDEKADILDFAVWRKGYIGN